MEYAEALKNYAATYNAMRNSLREWVKSKNGSFDKEDEVQGLDSNLKTHYDIRAEQLTHLLNYHQSAELEMKQLREEIARLKTENNLLRIAERNRAYTDEFVLQQVQFYKSWTLDTETTLKDFREHLRDTIKFFDLAINRQLVEVDEVMQSKTSWAVTFLKDDNRLQNFFFNKREQLKAADKMTVLDEYTADLAVNA